MEDLFSSLPNSTDLYLFPSNSLSLSSSHSLLLFSLSLPSLQFSLSYSTFLSFLSLSMSRSSLSLPLSVFLLSSSLSPSLPSLSLSFGRSTQPHLHLVTHTLGDPDPLSHSLIPNLTHPRYLHPLAHPLNYPIRSHFPPPKLYRCESFRTTRLLLIWTQAFLAFLGSS